MRSSIDDHRRRGRDTGFERPSPRGRRPWPRCPRVSGTQRGVADVAEAPVALLRREVARAQHRPVRVPVRDEVLDEAAHEREAVGSGPRLAPASPASGASVLTHRVGEREHGLLHVVEVLVEGRGRRARRRGRCRRPAGPAVPCSRAAGGGVEQARRVRVPRRPSDRPSSATGSLVIGGMSTDPERPRAGGAGPGSV